MRSNNSNVERLCETGFIYTNDNWLKTLKYQDLIVCDPIIFLKFIFMVRVYSEWLNINVNNDINKYCLTSSLSFGTENLINENFSTFLQCMVMH